MPTNKPKDKTSNIILNDVQVKNKEVILSFDKEDLSISLDDYLNDYYYPGKSFTKQEYQEIKAKSQLKKAKLYLSNLLSQNRYTVKQARDKLKTHYKNLKQKDIDNLLSPYLNSGILDDKTYAYDFIQTKQDAGYGKKYLTDELIKRGIPEDILKSEEIQAMLNLDNEDIIIEIIAKVDKQHQNETIIKKKQRILDLLKRRGFSYQEATDAINSYYSSLSEEENEKIAQNHNKLLNESARQCYNSLDNRHLDPKKKKDLFYRKMIRLGFKYDEINAVCEKERYFQS